MDKHEPNKEKDDMPKLGWSDLAAFMIAAFQIMVPAALILMGVLLLFYFLLRWWAGF
jgi:hypothetical protein